jgi:hypothetical protein
MKSLSFLVSAIAIACSSASAPTQPRIGDPNATIDTVQVNGALRLEVEDMPLMRATAPFDGPASITGGTGAVILFKSQYGSLCRYAIAGNADVNGSKIGVHIAFTERLTSCTADVRVLQYNATVTAAPGTYDVALIQERNAAVDTIARQSVIVR